MIELNITLPLFRWFDWDTTNTSKNGRLGLKASDKVLTKLEDVGQQMALAFSEDGSLLAVGGEVYMILTSHMDTYL